MVPWTPAPPHISRGHSGERIVMIHSLRSFMFGCTRSLRVAAIALAAVGAALVASLCATRAGAAVVYSTGFEQPTFALGSISGQDGWGINAGTATIQTATVQAGCQALRIASPSTVATRLIGIPVTGQTVTIEFDVRATTPGGSPFNMGVIGNTGFIGQINITGSSYIVGNTNSFQSIPGATFNVWHHVVLTLNFTTLSMVGTVDGNPIAPVAINNATAPTSITTVQFGNSGSSSGEAFFDNILISSIPTPGACCNRWTGACIVEDQATCTAHGLRFDGAGAACSPATCKACPADFNGTGGLTVSDIFAFLGDWFAGCP